MNTEVTNLKTGKTKRMRTAAGLIAILLGIGMALGPLVYIMGWIPVLVGTGWATAIALLLGLGEYLLGLWGSK